jgi:catechol 2,3-dioxygenase-like lactoylglutathione lyase family enzyme
MADALTYGLTHLSVLVRDLDRTKEFYETVFDMQVMYHSTEFLQLNTPGTNDAIVFVENKEFIMEKTVGYNHFGFRLKKREDIDEITRRVIAAGGVITDEGEFAPGFPKLFFKDPDGYEVEVWYE